MARKPLALHNPDLTGLDVLIVGLGRSGLAAAELALNRGARVVACDRDDESRLGEAVRQARELGIELRAGDQSAALARDFDLVVVSPGVPADVPVVTAARRLGTPVWGEVELAWRYCQGRLLCVTGSNGKSTVTSMMGTILRNTGVPGGTGGNLGTPLSRLLGDDRQQAVHAVELSSFQLETIETLTPTVAIVVNLSPDHLDRYETFEAYVAAKTRLLTAQRTDGVAILNADDRASDGLRDAVQGRLLTFSTRDPQPAGAWVADGAIRLRHENAVETVMPAAELPVPGEHNVANALAAAMACRLVGCSPADIAAGLRGYRGLDHRLQQIATLNDVRFFDDSKATNLDAAARALASFPAGSVHLILGGRDKGADWASLAPLVGRHARQVLLVGEAAPSVRDGLGQAAPMQDCDTVAGAVRAAFSAARAGETVLLSPGCASFDQYTSFEERGRDFQQVVAGLAGESGDA